MCESLKVRSEQYSAFVLKCEVTDKNKILSPDRWPHNVYVRKFIDRHNNGI